MEKIVNGKKITSAVVLIDKEGSILGCHGFGKPKDSGYDFPKGCVEEGESDAYAAARELMEEADIYLYDPYTHGKGYNKVHELIDCGIHPHNKEKDIHIFLFKVNGFPELKDLKCTSFFEVNGKKYPEIDGYEVITKENRNKFNKVLQNKFDIIDSFNK